MNAISLNSLWSYLQSLTLTTSNKKWLADHLYEAAREETQADNIMKPIEQLSPELQAIIGFAKPVTPCEDDINEILQGQNISKRNIANEANIP